MIPGGYVFSDPITGKQYRDMGSTFEHRVRQIINDRRANSRLFTDSKFIDPAFVAQQLSEAQCIRLKGNPLFCSNGLTRVNTVTTQPFTPAPAPAGKVCRYCKSPNLQEVLCQVCSGRKVVAYKCLSCHRENRK